MDRSTVNVPAVQAYATPLPQDLPMRTPKKPSKRKAAVMDDEDYESAKEEQVTGVKSKRKSAAGRKLIRWDFEKDQYLLLCLEYVCNEKGIQLPWDDATNLIKAGGTGQAAIQHLTKVRKARILHGQAVPPEPTKRRGKKKEGKSGPQKKQSKLAQEDDDDDEEINDQPFNGSKSRLVWVSNDTKVVQDATPSKAGHRDAKKMKIEKVSSDDVQPKPAPITAPGKNQKLDSSTVLDLPPKKKRGRPFGKTIKAETAAKVQTVPEATPTKATLSQVTPRRATLGISYKGLDAGIESEEEEDQGDDATYDYQEPYDGDGDGVDDHYGDDLASVNRYEQSSTPKPVFETPNYQQESSVMQSVENNDPLTNSVLDYVNSPVILSEPPRIMNGAGKATNKNTGDNVSFAPTNYGSTPNNHSGNSFIGNAQLMHEHGGTNYNVPASHNGYNSGPYRTSLNQVMPAIPMNTFEGVYPNLWLPNGPSQSTANPFLNVMQPASQISYPYDGQNFNGNGMSNQHLFNGSYSQYPQQKPQQSQQPKQYYYQHQQHHYPQQHHGEPQLQPQTQPQLDPGTVTRTQTGSSNQSEPSQESSQRYGPNALEIDHSLEIDYNAEDNSGNLDYDDFLNEVYDGTATLT